MTLPISSGSEAHSNFIGGSNARARIACPASWQMEQKLPASAKKETSTYADEGSALHAAIAHALNENLAYQDLLGMTFAPFEQYPITQELIDTALAPCMDFFDLELDDEPDPLTFYIEKRVAIPDLPGVFGTCDLIGRNKTHSVIGDWKFGVGEKVSAWYGEDPSTLGYGKTDGPGTPNAQLMFYLLGAINTCPEMFNLDDPAWPIDIFIGQPRHRDGPNFDTATVTMKDVRAFRAELNKAAGLARLASPPMAKGDHCRFMPCKAICPLHTGPLFELTVVQSQSTMQQLEAAVDGGVGAATVDWGNTYRRMLDLCNQIEPLLRDWRAQAQAYAEDGGNIPDWKLVEKRATRKWVRPEKSVERRLARMGLGKDERMPRALLTPPQAEKLLKTKGKSLPAGYFDAISSGTTLAPADDRRQSVEPISDAIASLNTALATIRGEF